MWSEEDKIVLRSLMEIFIEDDKFDVEFGSLKITTEKAKISEGKHEIPL